MNVALSHHWLSRFRGGEKVLQQIAGLFPEAPIHTLIHNRNLQIPEVSDRPILPSGLQRLPGAQRAYRHLLPFHPLAIKRMRVPESADLLLSSDASLIKGIPLAESTTHVCYCHSPPRYLWEMRDEYKRSSVAARVALDRFAPSLRRFDYQAAQRVDHFIANSKFVAQRIRDYYGRDSEVIYPPVAVDSFRHNRARKPFWLVVSELVPYKRIDLAVSAFNRLGRPLVVIGDGPERKRLQTMAKSNVTFLGRQPFAVLKEHLETAASFVFPGVEDFGITPVEAQAAGCPVVAYRAGGALETVVENRTGVFFDQQNADSLAGVIASFDHAAIDPRSTASHASSFSEQAFRDRYVRYLARVLPNRLGQSVLSAAHVQEYSERRAG